MLIAAQSSAAAIQTGTSGLAKWRTLTKDLDERLQRFAKEPLIAREIDYVRSEIGKVRTADELVGNRRLFEFVLMAYDLEGQENAQALMKRVLSEDLDRSTAAANRMGDSRYVRVAADLGFAGSSGSDGQLVSRMVDHYVRAVYEQRTGDELPAATTEAQDVVLARIAAEPGIEAEIVYAREALTQHASARAVAEDDRLLAFAAKAAGFGSTPGLPDDVTARIITDKDFRTSLGDEKWDRFAAYFGPASRGRAMTPDRTASAVESIVDRWVKASFTLETGRQVTGTMSTSVTADLEAYRERSDVQATIATFESEMRSVETPSDLLVKVKSYKFVMRAFGLESQAKSTDMVLRALLEPPGSRFSPATFDKRWGELADGLGFLAASGASATRDEAFVDTLINKYVRVQLERAIGATDIDMRQALYAQRKLPGVTSAFQILGDTPLRNIVMPAIGLSASSTMDVDRLADLVERKVDMTKLNDAAYVEKLTQRFFAQAGGGSSSAATESASVIALLGSGGGGTTGFGLDLLLQMQANR